MASVPPRPTDDNIEPSAREAIKLYAKEFAGELAIKAQILAAEKNRKATRDDVQRVWKRLREGGKRPFWKDVLVGGGWAFLGAFAQIFFENVRTGSSIAPLYVAVCLVGIVFIYLGSREPA